MPVAPTDGWQTSGQGVQHLLERVLALVDVFERGMVEDVADRVADVAHHQSRPAGLPSGADCLSKPIKPTKLIGLILLVYYPAGMCQGYVERVGGI